MSLQVRAEKSPWASRIELLVMMADGNQIVAAAQPLVMQKVDPASTYPQQATCALTGPDAQLLMDDLWRAGIRPSEGSGSAGQLAATERHLAHVMKSFDLTLGHVLKDKNA